MRSPSIAYAKIDRLAAPEKLGIGRLVSAGEFGDRTGIAAERKEPPFPGIVVRERNAGIVLNDGGAVGEDEIAHRREISGVEQIGCALEQAIAGRECFAKLQETLAFDTAVGKIGR